MESFAGSRIVLNLQAISFDVSTDAFDTTGGGALSSHIVFTTHSPATTRARTPSVRWDWGGLREFSRDELSGHAPGGPTGTAIGTIISESYEMTSTMSAGGTRLEHNGKTGASTTDCQSPNTCSDTCVDEQDVV
jgi:hypothetical protein